MRGLLARFEGPALEALPLLTAAERDVVQRELAILRAGEGDGSLVHRLRRGGHRGS